VGRSHSHIRRCGTCDALKGQCPGHGRASTSSRHEPRRLPRESEEAQALTWTSSAKPLVQAGGIADGRNGTR
jgi:hypothetical protein